MKALAKDLTKEEKNAKALMKLLEAAELDSAKSPPVFPTEDQMVVLAQKFTELTESNKRQKKLIAKMKPLMKTV